MISKLPGLDAPTQAEMKQTIEAAVTAVLKEKVSNPHRVSLTEHEIRTERNAAQADYEKEHPRPFRTSKSGKKMTVQYGTSWYEEHDTSLYTPLKVLTDLIPEGAEGHVRHRDGIRLLRRLMAHPGFGLTAQIALSIISGKGVEREYVTYLLTKKQYLWMASALSDEYLALAINHQYASLSEYDKAMKSSDFTTMIKQQTVDLWNEDVSKVTVEQANATRTTMQQLDTLLATAGDIEEVRSGYAEAYSEAKVLVEAFQLNNPDTVVPEEEIQNAVYRLESAVAYRDLSKALLAEQIIPTENAAEMVLDIRKKITYANAANSYINYLDVLITNPDMRNKYMLQDNSPIHSHMYDIRPMPEDKVQITKALKQDNVPSNVSMEDIIEFGLYMVVYNRMTHTEMQNRLDTTFQQKHNCTPKQTARIATVIELQLTLPKFTRGLAVVVRPEKHCMTWQIFTAYR